MRRACRCSRARQRRVPVRVRQRLSPPRQPRRKGGLRAREKSFVCPYHAWTYGRDGRLQVVTHEAGFTGIDRDARGLVRVPVGEAGGLVWVRASPSTSPEDSRLDAAAFLGELADDLGRFGVASSHVYSPQMADRDLNWKLAIDVFLETYHVRPTHKNTIYPLFFDNLGLVDRVGTHLRTVIPKRTIRDLANEPDEVVGSALRIHANVVFHLFPNTIVLIQPDHASVMTAWPVGIARTRLMTYTLVPEPPDDKARSYWDLNNAILHTATEEDRDRRGHPTGPGSRRERGGRVRCVRARARALPRGDREAGGSRRSATLRDPLARRRSSCIYNSWSHPRPGSGDGAQLLCSRARRLDRVLARIYDGALRTEGVTGAQLGMLVATRSRGRPRPRGSAGGSSSRSRPSAVPWLASRRPGGSLPMAACV